MTNRSFLIRAGISLAILSALPLFASANVMGLSDVVAESSDSTSSNFLSLSLVREDRTADEIHDASVEKTVIEGQLDFH